MNLLIQNIDKLSVIGMMGATFGKHNVNITNMHLTCALEKNQDMSIIPVDDEAPFTLRGHPPHGVSATFAALNHECFKKRSNKPPKV